MTTQQSILKSPFPYYGGKSAIADMVWQRFGHVVNFVDPFFGSGAILLSSPHQPKIETVNDLNGLLCNFWRALQADPDQVAHYAAWPVNETDLHARHAWLMRQKSMVEQLIVDPDWYDAKIAGWWVWGASAWIGAGWCDEKAIKKNGNTEQKGPHLSDDGCGVHRMSLWQQMPHLSGSMGVHRTTNGDMSDYFHRLADRLRRVRVCCGDWTRVLGPSVTSGHGMTAIFLDPPYLHTERDSDLYASESNVADDVRAWAIANGDNPFLRMCVCGYQTPDYTFPATWTAIPWKAHGGYANRSDKRGKLNKYREMCWFSPHCLDLEALPLFAERTHT